MTLKTILIVFAVGLVLVVAKSKSPEVDAVEKEAKLTKKYHKHEMGKWLSMNNK